MSSRVQNRDRAGRAGRSDFSALPGWTGRAGRRVFAAARLDRAGRATRFCHCPVGPGGQGDAFLPPPARAGRAGAQGRPALFLGLWPQGFALSWVLFVDLVKAFDSVPLDVLLRIRCNLLLYPLVAL